jgi:hypothetical protein
MYVFKVHSQQSSRSNVYCFPKHPADKHTKQLSAQCNRNTSSRLIAIIILCFRLEDLQLEPTETNDPTNKFQQTAGESD